MSVELSVVMLCYGAGQRAYGFADKVINLLDKSVSSWELILVGNYREGSYDETPETVRKIASSRKNVVAITLPKQGMMGWDARSGMDAASGRYICLIDGDEQMPPEDIIKVYEKLKKEGIDFAKTYRVRRHDSFIRRANSKVFNFLFCMMFPGLGIRDVNSKPKIFTKEAYDRMLLKSDDWFIDAEIMIQARRSRLSVGEVPTEFFKNEYRKSYVKIDAVFEFIKNMILARAGEFFR
ncbi:MAG: glycosyltransferase family 2 protein [Candidatus Omnitrophica bacterium]|nr:glycosyltransferase family 2 protein [Candidatus Omnitrophota bacterium]